jgi:hypothetical protein
MNSEKYYDFETQCKIEEEVTPIIMAFLQEHFDGAVEDIRHLHSESDFRIGQLTFDLKADTRVGQTQNLFIEVASVVKDGQVLKQGWFYNQSTDWILYVSIEDRQLFMLDLKRLQKYYEAIRQYPFREIKQNKNYTTQGHLVPLRIIQNWLKFVPSSLQKYYVKTSKVRG